MVLHIDDIAELALNEMTYNLVKLCINTLKQEISISRDRLIRLQEAYSVDLDAISQEHKHLEHLIEFLLKQEARLKETYVQRSK